MASLNYHHLRYFWAVAHEGNLTRAAARLNVAQSALSVQIQQLEAQLGHALFERRGKALLLTEAGRIALQHADAIFAAGDELVGTLKERGGAARPMLRVGALATLSRNFQLRFLGPLLGRADLRLVLRSGALADLLAQLEAHRLDVVLATAAPPREADTGWVAHLLDEQPVSLVARPELARDAPLATVLGATPLILPSGESSIRSGFDALAQRLGVTPQIAAEVDDMAMLRLLARERVGAAVVPPIVVADELASGMLVELHRFSELAETFYAITTTRRFPNPLLAPLLARRRVGEAG